MRPLPLLLLAACAAADGPSDTDTAPHAPALLVDHAAWTATPAEDDPFADHRPEPVVCGPGGTKSEDGGIEVDTNYCDHLAVSQPSLVDAPAGSEVSFFFFHEDLRSADEGAQAHVALLLGAQVLWEQHLDIPADPAPFSVSTTLSDDAPAGTPVFLHLHNHGTNTYKMLAVEVLE